MTQKEKLITELFELNRQYYANEGKKNPWNDTPSDHDLWSWSRDNKVYDLERSIQEKRRSLQQQAVRMERDRYFATDEGKRMKQATEKRIGECREAVESLHTDLHAFTTNSVQEYIGVNFICTAANFGYNSIRVEIGLQDPARPDRCLFGHDFSVRYGEKFCLDDEWEMEINYGTLGAFNALEDTQRIEYLQGLAKFASDRQLKRLLVEKFNTLLKVHKRISKEYDQLQRKLENPLA